MALTGLVASINASIHVESAKVDGISNLLDTLDLGKAVSILFGTGAAGKADQIWHDRAIRAIGTDSIDLNGGGLKNAFGETVTFDSVKAILIINQSNISWGAHTANSSAVLVIGGNATPFTFLGDGSDLVYLQSGDYFLLTNTDTGWPVGAGTTDILDIEATVAEALYDIVLIGEKA